MLYQTLQQPKLLVYFLIIGIVGGLIFDLGNFVKFLFLNKKLPCILLDIIETGLCLFIIFYYNLKLNYGIIRLFPFICFMFSFIMERYTLGKLIAKIYLSCYNLLIKINKRIWRKKNAKTNKND